MTLIRRGTDLGLAVSVSPSGTPTLTRQALADLRGRRHPRDLTEPAQPQPIQDRHIQVSEYHIRSLPAGDLQRGATVAGSLAVRRRSAVRALDGGR
jgi:hypothetical protein